MPCPPHSVPAARLAAERGRLHDHAHSRRLARCGGKPTVTSAPHESAGKRRARRGWCACARTRGKSVCARACVWHVESGTVAAVGAPRPRTPRRQHAVDGAPQSRAHARLGRRAAREPAVRGTHSDCARAHGGAVAAGDRAAAPAAPAHAVRGRGRAQCKAGRSLCRCRNARNCGGLLAGGALAMPCLALPCVALLCCTKLRLCRA